MQRCEFKYHSFVIGGDSGISGVRFRGALKIKKRIIPYRRVRLVEASEGTARSNLHSLPHQSHVSCNEVLLPRQLRGLSQLLPVSDCGGVWCSAEETIHMYSAFSIWLQICQTCGTLPFKCARWNTRTSLRAVRFLSLLDCFNFPGGGKQNKWNKSHREVSCQRRLTAAPLCGDCKDKRSYCIFFIFAALSLCNASFAAAHLKSAFYVPPSLLKVWKKQLFTCEGADKGWSHSKALRTKIWSADKHFFNPCFGTKVFHKKSVLNFSSPPPVLFFNSFIKSEHAQEGHVCVSSVVCIIHPSSYLLHLLEVVHNTHKPVDFCRGNQRTCKTNDLLAVSIHKPEIFCCFLVSKNRDYSKPECFESICAANLQENMLSFRIALGFASVAHRKFLTKENKEFSTRKREASFLLGDKTFMSSKTRDEHIFCHKVIPSVTFKFFH